MACTARCSPRDTENTVFESWESLMEDIALEGEREGYTGMMNGCGGRRVQKHTLCEFSEVFSTLVHFSC